MFNKVIIIKEILPYLSKGKVGAPQRISRLEIVSAILYRLKTGCQWRQLPVKQFISQENVKWTSIYYHFNKWSKDGSWQKVWEHVLRKNRRHLDLSLVNLDGSHSRAMRGGEKVGYQGRKKYNSTNMLYLIDQQGVILFCSNPISGEHHDSHEIETRFQEIEKMAQNTGIELDGLFLNADPAFDCEKFRSYLESKNIIANIYFNDRNTKKNNDIDIYFDEVLYEKRIKCEHPFAWMDALKGLLNRYETLASNWLSMNLMGMIHVFFMRNKSIYGNSLILNN